jgi:hypothetical protein
MSSENGSGGGDDDDDEDDDDDDEFLLLLCSHSLNFGANRIGPSPSSLRIRASVAKLM